MRPTPLAVQPRVLQGLAAVGLTLALTTCAREAAGPPRHAAFSVAPVLSSDVSLVNLTVDNVRLIIVRPPADTVVDRTFAFPANQSSVEISADVPLEQSPETFQVTLQLLSGTTALFAGSQPVTLTAGATPPPTPIPVDTYIGPGQNVATLTIGPPDSVLTQGGTLQFRLTAKDAQGVDVPTFYASWTTSDTNVAKVSTTGVLTAPLSRATVNVVARTPNTQSQPNGVTASTSITFAPVATVLAIVSGCGQSGLLGTQLPLPVVAKVTAGDGIGVKGVVVTFAPPAGGAVTTPQVVTDANGLAQTLVTLPSTSGPAAFQVSAPGLTAQQCAQSAFGAAAKLAFVTQPSPTLAGSVIAPAVVVAAQDAQGTLVPTFTGNVTIALGNNPGNGTLSGTAAVAAVGGLATFSNLSIDKAGVGYTLVASAPSLTGATSAAFNIGGGTATRLLFTVQPAPVASGVAITPAVVVTALDALGNVAPTFAAGVTMSIDSGPAGAVLTGTSPVTAIGGVASFADLKLDKVGSYHLRAHATGLTDAISARFDVTIGLSRLLSFTAQPTNVTAGSVIAPPVQVSVKDLQGNTDATFNGNVVVAIATNPGGGTLSGIDTVAATAGVASFSTLSIDKSGIGYTLQATATGVTTGISTAFTVNPGAAARLAFLVPPTTVGVNAPITPAVVVAVEDALGNLVTTATNQIDLRPGVNPGNATLGGTTTLNAVNGLATFSNLTLNQPGTGYTLVAGSGSLTAATSPAFDVLPGATHFLVQVTPNTVTAGGSASVTVTAQDGLGNTVAGYRGTVHFLSSDPLATLPADYPFVAGDNGTHTFTGGVTLRTASSQLVDAVDAANSLISGSALVTVNPASAAKLAFMQQPSDVVQSATMSPAVQVAIEDQFGNVVVNATNTVNLTINPNAGGGVLTGGGSASPGAGIVTYGNLSIDKAGTGYTLQATASTLTSVTSTPFNVLGGATKQWTGALSTDWSSTGNWIGGVPTGSDDVLIPSGLSNYPTLSASSVVHNLTMGGASIETAGFPLDVFGNLDAPSGQITGTGTVLLDGTGVTLQGSLPNVQVGGTVRVIGPVFVVGDLDITGTGVVDLRTAQPIVVSGALTTGSSAVLVDTSGSVISVDGAALFSGGSEAGKLTNGTLQLTGNFTQNGDPESYSAQSTFITQFVGTGTQAVSFANPGTGAGVSHFGGLHVANTGVGVSLLSAAFADGALLGVGGGGVPALMLGNGHTLTVQGITLDSLIIDNMLLVVTNSAQLLFAQDVTFRNYSDPSATQLDITRTSGSATFTNLKFLGTPPNPGWHLQAHDPLIGNGAFTVTLVTPSPTAAGGARFTNAGTEAIIIWP